MFDGAASRARNAFFWCVGEKLNLLCVFAWAKKSWQRWADGKKIDGWEIFTKESV